MQYMENPSFHHAPEGYCDQENEKRKKHRFVGRKIWYHGKLMVKYINEYFADNEATIACVEL